MPRAGRKRSACQRSASNRIFSAGRAKRGGARFSRAVVAAPAMVSMLMMMGMVVMVRMNWRARVGAVGAVRLVGELRPGVDGDRELGGHLAALRLVWSLPRGLRRALTGPIAHEISMIWLRRLLRQ